jgi:CHASE3 domain sensor protein
MDLISLARRRTIVFPLACAAALAMLVISESSYWRSAGTLNQLGTMAAVSSRIQGLQQSVLDAETGQRGFLLTQRQELLAPYDKALQDVAAALEFLDH